ncbi:DUF3598 family protein [Phormidium sp. CLA17]|uniref:DUF3598 family protein n=1 Tax=Leptolyngbya sp. Cla-17 TaxID=2803751 RepID=UPI001492B18B|nr:DUF3598 family protein [Leptolyngbya sp. Cla-17]MBM0740636.1 DUF3598 family protein [Leptolyngbya sp. Cla-17]
MSQWDCLLQNLGEWQGSFTRFSAQGDELEDTPTVVSLEGLNGNQTIRQIIRRLTPEPSEKVLEYSTLGRGILFFEDGAFSQGALQFAPFSEFGAELGLVHGDRRLRLVQLFDQASRCDRLTLIREHLAGTTTPERPPLTVEGLLGTWQGEATTLYADWRTPNTFSSTLQIQREGDRLLQRFSFGSGASSQTIASVAEIDGNRLMFTQSLQPAQVVLLPDGASSNCPMQIKPGQSFVLEAGWLIQPNLRQRIIRSYSDKGEWLSLTCVTEQKVSAIQGT